MGHLELADCGNRVGYSDLPLQRHAPFLWTEKGKNHFEIPPAEYFRLNCDDIPVCGIYIAFRIHPVKELYVGHTESIFSSPRSDNG